MKQSLKRTAFTVLTVVVAVFVGSFIGSGISHAAPIVAQILGQVVAGCVGTTQACRSLNIDSDGDLQVDVMGGSGGTVTANQGTGASSGAGWAVYTQACSGATCYLSPVASGATAISAAASTSIFASTVNLTSLRCNNQNTAAVNFTVTDGSNNYFVGPNFSFPASSNIEFQPNMYGSIMTSGVIMKAGTANSINCWAKALQ